MIGFIKIILTALLIVVSVQMSAYAAHPLITDDTGTQGKSKYQLEVNAEYAREKEDGVTERAGELAVVLSYGMNDAADLVVGLPFQMIKISDPAAGIDTRESGASDLSVELKWRLFEKNGFSMAFKPGISIPTGDDEKGLGAGKVAYSGFLIATQELNPLILHLNAGYVRNENTGGERQDIVHSSLAAEFEATEKLKIVANIGTETNPDSASTVHPAFAVGGLIYSFSDRVAVDIGYKAGLNRPETDATYLAGIAIKF